MLWKLYKKSQDRKMKDIGDTVTELKRRKEVVGREHVTDKERSREMERNKGEKGHIQLLMKESTCRKDQ